MKKKVHYIKISEELVYYDNFDNTKSIELHRNVCIQRAANWPHDNVCRNYYNVSEKRILQLAKIQEKLAK